MSELKVGNSVKLNLNNKETIWVEIKEINGGEIKGTIDQHLRVIENFNFGDEITFNSENIIETLEN